MAKPRFDTSLVEDLFSLNPEEKPAKAEGESSASISPSETGTKIAEGSSGKKRPQSIYQDGLRLKLDAEGHPIYPGDEEN